ncbi:hypothetical protein DV736_g4494, partial [Chaetothyriales sp. CBS 134916]
MLVFGYTLIKLSLDSDVVLSQTIRALKCDLPPPAISKEEPKKYWDPQFYGPSRYIPREFDYRRLSSLSSPNGSFWPINLGRKPGYNANVIPHPSNNKLWIVVVQHEQYHEEFDQSAELACNAAFVNGALHCRQDARPLPIERSIFGVCEDGLQFTNLRLGPRDARVFYGPEVPFLMYGSQSEYICIGLWIQDVRLMLDAFHRGRGLEVDLFRSATELRRINTTGPIEKNYFLFWDRQGTGYVHYNLWPKRSFAELQVDGSESEDMAGLTAHKDNICMRKLMPPVAQESESIHQATNSLSITMCKRDETDCVPNDWNTYIMHIFHHKGYYAFHGVYEPFVVLFKNSAPFDLHAISKKPFWVEGRKNLTIASDSPLYRKHPEYIPENHTEFFYFTSMSWKTHGQKYHGFIDDELFLSFGIEDARSGVIDVRARDLLDDLALGICFRHPVTTIVNNAIVGTFKFNGDTRPKIHELTWQQMDSYSKAGIDKIMNIGTSLLLNPVPYHDYVGAKSALLAFTRISATEQGAMNITVNMVSGGLLQTIEASAATPNEVFKTIETIEAITPLRD